MAGRYRLGVDIGDTFTDVMVADEAGGVAATLTTPSASGALEEAIFSTLAKLRRGDLSPQDPAIFGVSDPRAPVTFVNVRATVVGETAKASRLAVRPIAGHASKETRAAIPDGAERAALLVPRSAVARGRRIAGPAIVEQYDTTTFVQPGYRVTADAAGTLVGEAA